MTKNAEHCIHKEKETHLEEGQEEELAEAAVVVGAVAVVLAGVEWVVKVVEEQVVVALVVVDLVAEEQVVEAAEVGLVGVELAAISVLRRDWRALARFRSTGRGLQTSQRYSSGILCLSRSMHTTCCQTLKKKIKKAFI